ncbi:MAG TPA: hypothetical protein VK912_12880 [Longimicrobiales bacterium]|nr:hypothetical protein [Longimicrobiales bacterium]
MKPVIRIAHAAAGLIVILLAGCDNVSWGGTDIAVVHPPPKAVEAPEGTEEAGVEPLPTEPVLYYVARTAEGGFMTPVGQISGDSIAPIRATGDAATYAGRFVAEFMRQGGEFTLFSGGRRAGTFVVHNAGVPETPTCPLLPTATGALELSSNVTAVEFLALARADAPTVPPRADRPEVPPGVRARIAPILAERAVRARGAELPGNWAAALEQVTAFPTGATGTNAYAATLLVGDTLGPGLDNTGYSLFFIFAPTASQTGYDTTYVGFRSYPETGKAAPRVVDYLDWSRDGTPELLLQVYGTSDSWFEAVGLGQDGSWRRIFRDRCEEGSRSVPTPAAADSAAAADTATG